MSDDEYEYLFSGDLSDDEGSLPEEPEVIEGHAIAGANDHAIAVGPAPTTGGDEPAAAQPTTISDPVIHHPIPDMILTTPASTPVITTITTSTGGHVFEIHSNHGHWSDVTTSVAPTSDTHARFNQANVRFKPQIATTSDDFPTMAREFALVDKTHAIEEFITSNKALHLLLRPRRSGKSLLISMMKYVQGVHLKSSNN